MGDRLMGCSSYTTPEFLEIQLPCYDHIYINQEPHTEGDSQLCLSETFPQHFFVSF